MIFAATQEARYGEASAKTGENVERVFTGLINEVVQAKLLYPLEIHSPIDISAPRNHQDGRGGCC
jgi:hypothetical protein